MKSDKSNTNNNHHTNSTSYLLGRDSVCLCANVIYELLAYTFDNNDIDIENDLDIILYELDNDGNYWPSTPEDDCLQQTNVLIDWWLKKLEVIVEVVRTRSSDVPTSSQTNFAIQSTKDEIEQYHKISLSQHQHDCDYATAASARKQNIDG